MIIVTGASKGLGNHICKRLLAQGEEVIGLSRDVNGLDFESYQCDITSYEEIKSVTKKIKSKHHVAKAIINAAGVASMNLALTTPENVTDRLIRTNLIGTIHCCQLFAPFLIKNKTGSIVNFSTIAVPIGLRGESVYVASKAGVEGFSKSFAREMSDFDIRVNCIAPGPINTNLIKGIEKSLLENVISLQIIRRQFEPDDVSDLVELLLSPKAKSISGQVLSVGGI